MKRIVEHTEQSAIVRQSNVPLEDQVLMDSAIRRLDVAYARGFFRKHLSGMGELTDDQVLSVLHAARCRDTYAGARMRAQSEDWLRARGMAVPEARRP